MSMLRCIEKALENDAVFTTFDGFYTKTEKENILPELSKEIDKAADIVQNGTVNQEISEADINHYAAEVGRLMRLYNKISVADTAPEDDANIKGHKALIGLDIRD